MEDCEQIYPNYEDNSRKVVEMKKNKAKEVPSWGDEAWDEPVPSPTLGIRLL